MAEILVELFAHNAWANERLFEACEGLSETQLAATLDGTFGSVRDTLVHIAGAQDRFVAALAETGPVRVFREWEPFPGVGQLRDAVRKSSDALVVLAEQAQYGASVTTTYRGEDFTLPVWLLFIQAINHATEHRTQIAAILTQQGIEPPGMDGWTYHEDVFHGDWSQLWSS